MATLPEPSNPNSRARTLVPAGDEPIALAPDVRVGLPDPPAAGNSVEDWLSHLHARGAFRGTWRTGQTYTWTEIVLRQDNIYACKIAAHTSDLPPEQDRHNWALLTQFQGPLPTGRAVPAGGTVTYNNGLWYATTLVLAGDPLPDADDNVKWVRATARTDTEIREQVADWAEEGAAHSIPWDKLRTGGWPVDVSTSYALDRGKVLAAALGSGVTQQPQWVDSGFIPAWTSRVWVAGNLVRHIGEVWLATANVDPVTQAEVDQDSSLTLDEKEPGTAVEWTSISPLEIHEIVAGIGGLAGNLRLSYDSLRDQPRPQHIDSWQVNRSYIAGDLTVWNEMLFRCTADVSSVHNPNVDPDHWNPIENSRGAWNDHNAYSIASFVSHNGRLYVSIVTFGPSPGDPSVEPGVAPGWVQISLPPLVSSGEDGLMSVSDKARLDGVENIIDGRVAIPAQRNSSNIWPADKLGQGTHNASTVLHGDSQYRTALTPRTNNEIDARIAPQARAGNTDRWHPEKLGSGSPTAEHTLQGDGSWRVRQFRGIWSADVTYRLHDLVMFGARFYRLIHVLAADAVVAPPPADFHWSVMDGVAFYNRDTATSAGQIVVDTSQPGALWVTRGDLHAPVVAPSVRDPNQWARIDGGAVDDGYEVQQTAAVAIGQWSLLVSGSGGGLVALGRGGIESGTQFALWESSRPGDTSPAFTRANHELRWQSSFALPIATVGGTEAGVEVLYSSWPDSAASPAIGTVHLARTLASDGVHHNLLIRRKAVGPYLRCAVMS